MKESLILNRKEYKLKSFNDSSFKINLEDDSSNFFFLYDYNISGKSVYTLKNMLRFIENKHSKYKEEKVIHKNKDNIQLPIINEKSKIKETENDIKTKINSDIYLKKNVENSTNTEDPPRSKNTKSKNIVINNKTLCYSKSIFSNSILDNVCKSKEDKNLNITKDFLKTKEHVLPKLPTTKNYLNINNYYEDANSGNLNIDFKNTINKNAKNFSFQNLDLKTHNSGSKIIYNSIIS